MGGVLADKFMTGPAKVSSQAMTVTSFVPRGWITGVLPTVAGRAQGRGGCRRAAWLWSDVAPGNKPLKNAA
jgi:hypothetical protein